MDNQKQKITHITILSQVLLNRLHDHTAENNFSKGLKYSAKKFVEQLTEVERKRFDKFFDHDKTASTVIYDGMDKFYEKVSNIEIEHLDAAILLLDLLVTNPKEIEEAINIVFNK